MSAATSSPSLPERWIAHWISPVEAGLSSSDRPAYLLERPFRLEEAPAAARLFATALGVYEAHLNGRRVGDEELAPGSSNYDRTLYAQSYEVRHLLLEGDNLLQLTLSDGWYRGRNGGGQHQDCWGDATAALAQLEMTLGDGSAVTIVTDDQWTSQVSSITRADLMTGQTTDFSAPPDERKRVRVGEVDAPVPSRSPAPPVRRVAELPPASVREIREGMSIVDFGQNVAGWVRLRDLGEAGAETVLEFGEHLNPDGDLDTAHLDTHTPRGEHIRFSQVDRVIAGGGASEFEPRHTVHGFRYVRITHPGRSLRAEALTAVVVRTDFDAAGQFVCSDERINRLSTMARRTFSANAVDIPTDCPTRERAGWTGDFQIFASTAAAYFDIEGFARKWLQAVRDDQFDDGCLSMISPDPLRMRVVDHPDRVGGGSAGWGDAAVAVPWTIYREYGDRRVLEESWQSAVAWVDFALGCARKNRHPSRIARSADPAEHEQYIWDGPFHFGEWLEPLPPGTGPRDAAEVFAQMLAADQGEVGTAYLYRSLRQLADIARVLERREDEARYRALAQHVRHAWVTEFLKETGRTALDTQAAYVRALAFELLPDGVTEQAAARLVELIAEHDDHLGTGFLSTGMLLPQLADNGYVDLAYRLLTRTGVPSWQEVAERGGTTFWENWDGVGVDGVARSGSLNHYSKGAVAEFFFTHILGLRQRAASAGWREFVVQPAIGGELTMASGTHRTRFGEITVSWQRNADRLELTLTAPAGTVGTIVLPGCDPVEVAGRTTRTVRTTMHDDAGTAIKGK